MLSLYYSLKTTPAVELLSVVITSLSIIIVPSLAVIAFPSLSTETLPLMFLILPTFSAEKPFIAINMAAIPKELIESELFGYDKGAYTGANANKEGKFEMANGGTILLDEISELDYSLQSKLLRVIQDKELSRVGSNNIIKLDVRILAATNRDLLSLIKNNKFRERFIL